MRPGQAVVRPLLVLAVVASFLVSGCSGTSQLDLDNAKAAGASAAVASQKQQSLLEEQARLAAEVKRLKTEAAKTKADADADAVAAKARAGASAAAQAPQALAQSATACTNNMSVGSHTSCAFGINVESAFYAAGGGTHSIEVYSPVTGTFYTMSCYAGVPSVCRGGNDAVVYIR